MTTSTNRNKARFSDAKSYLYQNTVPHLRRRDVISNILIHEIKDRSEVAIAEVGIGNGVPAILSREDDSGRIRVWNSNG